MLSSPFTLHPSPSPFSPLTLYAPFALHPSPFALYLKVEVKIKVEVKVEDPDYL